MTFFSQQKGHEASDVYDCNSLGILLVELKVVWLCYVRSTKQAGVLFSEHFKTTWFKKNTEQESNCRQQKTYRCVKYYKQPSQKRIKTTWIPNETILGIHVSFGGSFKLFTIPKHLFKKSPILPVIFKKLPVFSSVFVLVFRKTS